MHPNIFPTNKQVTKLTDKARAALEDKLTSVTSKKQGKDDQTHMSSTSNSVSTINGYPDKAPAQEMSTNGTAHKRCRVEVEDVDKDEEDNCTQQASQLPENGNTILIGPNDEQRGGEIKAVVDSKEDLTPEDKL
ncbi:hypothetical protein PAXRUDRAFT_29272, partial [Paxillus rubicundulus Ve08.2h10]